MLDLAPPPEGRSLAPPGPESLAQHVARRAREFDAAALVALLSEKFPELPIRFAGHVSLATQGTLVHAVAFAADHVLVTLNLGLQSATSPLPSYFLEMLAHPTAGPALEGLLATLDDRLLRDRVDALREGQSERLLPRSRTVRGNLLALARPGAPVTVAWLFEKVFPELGVSVRRAPVRRALASGDPRLGTAIMGATALGGEAELSAPGLDVILWADESTTWIGEGWATEARRRLPERVFPALEHSGVHLRILLVDLEGQGQLALRGVSFLGFDPLTRGAPPKVLVLFEGRVPERGAKVVRPQSIV